MRLKLDENRPTPLAVVLRNSGHDVHTVADENLSGCPDDEVWAAMMSERRLLITLDRDFGRLAIRSGGHAGAIVLRPREPELMTIVALAMRAVALADEIGLNNRVAVVEDERIRIRPPLAVIPPQEPS